MGELVIQTHSFELAKRGLKEFSQKAAEEIKIDSVDICGGFLGLGDHKVTGYEFNKRLGVIQQHLIDLNTTNNRTIKEFGQVYSALEALDKDYIQAILVSIKATEKTSERIKATQDQIKVIVEDQKKTLEVLKKFKKKLDGYAHLGDIDRLWGDCQKWHAEMAPLGKNVSAAMSTGDKNTKTIKETQKILDGATRRISQLSENLNAQIKRLETVTSFMNGLEKITHLKDIDDMWISLSNAHASLQDLCNELNSAKVVAAKHQEEIEKILAFVNMISHYEHLKDVDVIWDKVEQHSEELVDLTEQSNTTIAEVHTNQAAIAELVAYKQKLSAIVHLGDVDTVWDNVEVHGEKLDNLAKKSETTIEAVHRNQDAITKLAEYRKHLLSIAHLDEIDSVWDNVEAHSEKLSELTEQSNNTLDAVESNQIAIAELANYKQKISSIVHLSDVDSMWDTNETHSSQIAELQSQDEEMRSLIQGNKDVADQALAEWQEKTAAMMQQINKKIRYAYWVAGGSLALAFAELVAMLLR